jgi:class 3 adenylate cyclase
MITDLRSFTLLAEQMGTEDAVTMLNHYFSIMVEVIHKYKGTVIEFLGDAILVIFGAPVAYENHADCAVACAVEMQMAMETINKWNVENQYPELEIGIGVNTGETIVGNIGSPKTMKYNVIGKTVNLASRVESYCTGGQIMLSEYTYKNVKATLGVVQVIEVLPKGVKTPINVYQIDSIGAPFDLGLKLNEEPLKRLPEPAPISIHRIVDKQVAAAPLRYYILAASTDKALIIAGKGVSTLGTFEDVRLVNERNSEAFAKVIRTTQGGVVIIRFTSDAKEFIKFEEPGVVDS